MLVLEGGFREFLADYVTTMAAKAVNRYNSAVFLTWSVVKGNRASQTMVVSFNRLPRTPGVHKIVRKIKR